MSTRNVLDHLADHVAIRDLIDQYTAALNSREWDALGRCFTDDAVWIVLDSGRIEYQLEGADVGEGLRRLVESGSGTFQMNHAVAIDIEGDKASARSSIEAINRAADGSHSQLLAVYHDEIVRESDLEWRFKRREFHVWSRFAYAP